MTEVAAPYLRVGYPLSTTAEKYADDYRRRRQIACLEDPLSHPDNKGRLGHEHYWSVAASNAADASMGFFLRAQWREAIKWADKSGDAFEQYFFGTWQATAWYGDKAPDGGKWFEAERPWVWLGYFEMELPWLAVARRWRWLDRLMEFPRPALAVDNDEQVERRYYLGLGRWWRDRNDLAGFDELMSKGGAGSKQYRLLVDVCRAITDRDEAALAKTVTKSLQHFLKQRSHPEHLPQLPLVLVWGAARRDGLSVDFPPDVSKWLFEIPESYWATHEEPTE